MAEEENKKFAASSYNNNSNNIITPGLNPWWWGTSSTHNMIITPHHSQWLQATLSDLDEKTKAMESLIIQEDGESFAQRAEMYYKNKPVLIKMVKELHRSYRSLAERYDQLRSESVRTIQPRASSIISPSSDSFNHIQDLHNSINHSKGSFGSSSSSGDDSKLETPYESNPESTVEDPPDHLECEMPKSDFIFLNRNAQLGIGENQGDDEAKCRVVVVLDTEMVDKQKSTGIEMGRQTIHGDQFTMGSLNREDMWTDMKLQLSKLMEENLQQQSELIRRNDQKREAIKDLCFQLDRLTTENKTLQNCLKCSKVGMKQNQSQISKLKALIFGKLLG